MSYPPGQSISVRNNGVGLVSTAAALPLVVGFAVGATPNTLYQFTDPNTARTELSAGPALEDVLSCVAAAGGCLFLATAATTPGTATGVLGEYQDPGTIGSVTHLNAAGDGAGTGPSVSLAGSLTGTYEILIEITAGGALGTGEFRWSLDDGSTWEEEEITIPAGGTYVLGNTGITATFASGNYVQDETYAATATAGGGTLAVSGTYHLEFDVVVQITTSGGLGVGRFRYSLDGVTFGVIRTIPAGGTFAIPGTSITLTFDDSDEDFVAGDLYRFQTTAPHYTTGDLTTAKTALLEQIGARRIRRAFFSGRNASTSDGAAMGAAIATFLADLETEFYFSRALFDAGVGTPAEFVSDYAAFSNDRVGVTFGDARAISRAPFEGYSNVRGPILGVVLERAAVSDLSENLGRKASGSLARVTEIFHDEGTNTQFTEADKVITLRTYRGEAGVYITNGYLRSPAGSDFLYWDWGLVVDELCEAIYDGQNRWLLSSLRVRTDGSGGIADEDAIRVEDAVRTVINARLVEPTNVEGFRGHVSGVGYAVDRTNNFLSTRTLRSTGNAVPLVPIETIQTVVGLARSI